MEISAKDVMALRKKTGAGMMDCKKALKETEGDFDAAIKYLREKGMAAAKKRAEKQASEGRIVIRTDESGNAAMVEVNSETDFVARNSEFVAVVDGLAGQAIDLSDKADDTFLIPVDNFNIDDLKELSGKLGENLQFNRAGLISAGDAGMIESYIHPGDMLGVLVQLDGDSAAVKTDAAKTLAHDLALQIAAAAPEYVRREEVPQDRIDKEIEIYKNQMRNEGKPEAILDKIAMGKINKYYEESCLTEQLYVKEQKTKVSARISEAAKEAGGDLNVVRFLRFKVGEGNN